MTRLALTEAANWTVSTIADAGTFETRVFGSVLDGMIYLRKSKAKANEVHRFVSEFLSVKAK